MRKLLLILILLGGVVTSYSQEALSSLDSMNATSSAQKTIELLVAQRVARMSDSIQQAAIESSITQSRTASEKAKLEIELYKLKSKDSIRMEALRVQIDSARRGAIGYPYTLGMDTICLIYTANGSFTAQERAQTNSRKLEEVAQVYISSDSLTIRSDESLTQILFGEKVLISITASDAMWMQKRAGELAVDYRDKMVAAIKKYQYERSWSTIFRQVGLSLLVLIGCGVVVWLIAFLFRRKVNPFMNSKQDIWFKGLKIRTYEILDSGRELALIQFVVKIFKWFLTLLAIYIALPLLFNIFPFTQRLANTLIGWILNPIKKIFIGIWHYIPDLLTIVVVLFVMRYVLKSIKVLADEIQQGKLVIPGFYPDWAHTTYSLVRILVYILTFISIFPYLPGSDSKVFQGVSVLVGVIFSLGSTSVISNMMAGLVITYMRPFLKGDHVKIGDVMGDVLEKTPFVTRIKTYRKEIVTIPNAQILSGNVINYSTTAREEGGIAFSTTITIGYDVDWRKVHSMMIEAALRSDLIIKDPAPYVLQTSLDDSYVSYQLCAYSITPQKQARVYSELNQNIQDVFNENNVEIMSPLYRAVRNGNPTTVPPATEREPEEQTN